ncbi:aminodeoxychorismate lyase [Pseudoalteromonas sp. A25]|uniref:endolytic transglycosylase MltG n=1 Tax=Pseudoalteromonas sp. A25 TaxID=116092 RepID=UPI001260F50B|nr:endolytic transglycosylase MltG [Pseudoalteromonas sp. A25]BBN81890.1 aminodeoxychorismate lyase [Pseudoalteromonas sp. A25]
MIKRILLTVVFSLLIIGGFLVYQLDTIHNEPINIDTDLYEVEAGVGFNRLCNDWQKRGYIRSCLKYQIYSKFLPRQFQLKAGVYELRGLRVLEAIAKIHRGEQKQFAFTIIAGETFDDVFRKLAKSPYLTVPEDKQQLQTALKMDTSPEGWFLPETYHYEAYSNAASLLMRANLKMQKVLAQAWQQRVSQLPLESPYQALILASIIEKETGYAPERNTIASVFVNRLNKKMRLQTDPTVIYGLGETFDGDIKRSHLKQYTPYNTYRIKGLPPTPIAMPSADAIYAATQPAETPFYYFVSKGDGQHQFSKSLREHNQAVQKYILKRNNDS